MVAVTGSGEQIKVTCTLHFTFHFEVVYGGPYLQLRKWTKMFFNSPVFTKFVILVACCILVM